MCLWDMLLITNLSRLLHIQLYYISGTYYDRHLVFLQFPPEKFVEIMKLMEHRYGAKDFVTSKDCSLLSPGTYYLTEVDSMYRRFYAKKTEEKTTSTLANGH